MLLQYATSIHTRTQRDLQSFFFVFFFFVIFCDSFKRWGEKEKKKNGFNRAVLTRKTLSPDLLHSSNLHVAQQVCKTECSIRLSTRSTVIRMWTMRTNSRRPIQLLYYSTFPCKYQSNKSHNRHLCGVWVCPMMGRKREIMRLNWNYLNGGIKKNIIVWSTPSTISTITKSSGKRAHPYAIA